MQQRIHHPGQPEALADHVLVRQALAGDEGAFEILVRRYHTQVFHFIRHYISDYDQAWDVLQQVLLKLSASLPKLCLAQEQLGPWLFQVARNCCIDELRKKRMLCFSELEWDADEEEGEPSPLASRADPSPSPEETVEYHEVQRMLHVINQTLGGFREPANPTLVSLADMLDTIFRFHSHTVSVLRSSIR